MSILSIQNRKDDNSENEIFYEGKLRSISEAGALLVKSIIEEDLPQLPFFQPNEDPYKCVSAHFGKTVRAVTNWSYNWEGASGAKPTITDFFRLLRITRSKRAVNFICNLVSEETPYLPFPAR